MRPLDDSSSPRGAERTCWRSFATPELFIVPTLYLSARVVGGGAALGRARKESAAASPRTDGTVVEGAAEEGAAEEGTADDMAHRGHAACGNRALVDGAAEEGAAVKRNGRGRTQPRRGWMTAVEG